MREFDLHKSIAILLDWIEKTVLHLVRCTLVFLLWVLNDFLFRFLSAGECAGPDFRSPLESLLVATCLTPVTSIRGPCFSGRLLSFRCALRSDLPSLASSFGCRPGANAAIVFVPRVLRRSSVAWFSFQVCFSSGSGLGAASFCLVSLAGHSAPARNPDGSFSVVCWGQFRSPAWFFFLVRQACSRSSAPELVSRFHFCRVFLHSSTAPLPRFGQALRQQRPPPRRSSFPAAQVFC
jgi:hypothetical protein